MTYIQVYKTLNISVKSKAFQELFAESPEALLSFMSVRLSACISATHTEWVSVEFDISDFVF